MTFRSFGTTYWFDRLVSQHHAETQQLERAVASNCHTLRANVQSFRDSLAFRHQPNSEKLAIALSYAMQRLPDASDDMASALCAPARVPVIASVLVDWLDIYARPAERVAAFIGVDGTALASGVEAVDAMREVVAFGHEIVNAREHRDLEFAAHLLRRAATIVTADTVIGILLGQVAVHVLDS